MTWSQHRPVSSLRLAAEAALAQMDGNTALDLTEADRCKLLHELQVHQIELEMQNQALREAEVELAAMLSQFRELYDLAPVAYYTLDGAGVIVRANALGERLLGTPPGTAVGYRLSTFILPDQAATFAEFLFRTFSRRTLEVCQLSLANWTGGPPKHVMMEGIADDHGERCRLVVNDLTRQCEAEKALQAAEQRATELASAKAAADATNSENARNLTLKRAEIRTGGNTILGKVDALRMTPLSAKQSRYLDDIERASAHLLGITDDFPGRSG